MATKTGRLSRDAWIEAALEALADGGVRAVAVEPLAKRLGVTKGSFYWHFRDRNDLLESALRHWERERTDALLARAEGVHDPRERFEIWASYALAADKSLLIALHAAAGHPLIGPVLERVTARRIAWLAELLRDAGTPPAVARRRGRLLYAADIGLFEIALALGEGRPSAREQRATARELARAFLDEAAG